MENKKLVGVGIVGAAMVIGGIAYASRDKKAPPESAPTIVIEILDAQGNPVPHNSPAALTEGASYSIRLTVRNTSTKGGMAWPATLSLDVYAGTNEITLTYPPITAFNFDGGQTRVLDSVVWPALAFNVPMGTGGQAGNIIARVLNPTVGGVDLAKAVDSFTITTIAIIYGATIVIG